MSRLKNKGALITGGSRGQGEATARLFIEQGAKVVIADVLDQEGQQLARTLGHEHCRYCHLDVSQEDQWQQVMQSVEETFGGLDILLNNAGVMPVASVADTTLTEFQRAMNINQVGTFLGIKSAIEPMKKRGGGSMINISSFQALQCSNGLLAYSASKWAIRGMTKTAAIELGPYGIRVNSVHPGGIYTKMAGATGDTPTEADNQPYLKQPIPRVGLPIEVANLSLFLASDEASYCTGSEFKVDGGWNAGLRIDLLPTT